MEPAFRLLSKQGNELTLAFRPSSSLKAGDCITVTDESMQLVAQAYDLRYGGLRKTLFELLARISGDNQAARLILELHSQELSETHVAKCMIRGTVQGTAFVPGVLALPGPNARVEKLSGKQLLAMLALRPKKPADIGCLYGSAQAVEIDLAALQGVTLVTGRKGSGKSHLAKKLLEHVIANNAPAIVLDVNGEYANLKSTREGRDSTASSRLTELVPGRNFFIPLDGISFETFCRMCQIEENHNAFRLFARYWAENESGKSLEELRQWVVSSQSPPGSLNAAMARIDYASSLGIFGEYDLAAEIKKIRSGGAIILNLFKQGEKAKELSIVYVLRQLIASGLRDEGKIFLFAEEAQNYFEKEFWDDVVTRMRHLGIYSVIITNEPTTLPSMVFRQCDNLFAFNFSSDNDIAFVSNAQVIDPKSLSLIKNLGVGQCAAIGKCTNGFPLIINVSQTSAKAGGETKLLWE